MDNITILGVVLDSVSVNNTVINTILGYTVQIRENGAQRMGILSDKEMFTKEVADTLSRSMSCNVTTKDSFTVNTEGKLVKIKKKYYVLVRGDKSLTLDETCYLNIAKTTPNKSNIIVYSNDSTKIKGELVDRLRLENAEYYGIIRQEMDFNVNPNLVQSREEVPDMSKKITTATHAEPYKESASIGVAQDTAASVRNHVKEIITPLTEETKPPLTVAPVTRTETNTRRPSTFNPEIILPIPDSQGLYNGLTEEEYTYNVLIFDFLNSGILSCDYGGESDSDDIIVNPAALMEVQSIQKKLEATEHAVNLAKKKGVPRKEIYVALIQSYKNATPLHLGGRVIDVVTGEFLDTPDNPGVITRLRQGQAPSQAAQGTTQVNVPPVVSRPTESAGSQGTMTVSKILKYIKYKNIVAGYLVHIKGALIVNNKKIPLDNTTAITQDCLYKYMMAMPGFTKVINGDLILDHNSKKAQIQVNSVQANEMSPNPLNRLLTPLELFDLETKETGEIILHSKYSELTKQDTDTFKSLAQRELDESNKPSVEEFSKPKDIVKEATNAPEQTVMNLNTTIQAQPKVQVVSEVQHIQEEPVRVPVEKSPSAFAEGHYSINENTQFIGVFKQNDTEYVVYTNDFIEFKRIPTGHLLDIKSKAVTVSERRIFIELADGAVKALNR